MTNIFLCSEHEDDYLKDMLSSTSTVNIYAIGIDAPEFLQPYLTKNIVKPAKNLQSTFEFTLDLIGDGNQIYLSPFTLAEKIIIIGNESFDNIASAALLQRKLGTFPGVAKGGYIHRINTIESYLYYPDKYLPIDAISQLHDYVMGGGRKLSIEQRIKVVLDWLINGQIVN